MNLLIAGAGILGRTLCTLALDRGCRVTLLAYSADEFKGLAHPNLQTITCDVTQPESLQGVCSGIDFVISCIGITRMKEHLTHEAVDYQGNLNLLREAEKSGVKKFGFISPAGVDEGKNHVPLLHAKHLFESALKRSPIDWLIFRSGGFFSDLAGMLDMAKKGTLFVIGSGEHRSTPIDVQDLATILLNEMDRQSHRILSIGGPEDLSWNEICRACFEQCGRKPRLLRIPEGLCKITLRILKPFSTSYHAMGRLILFMSTRDLLTEKRGTRRFADYLRESAEQ